MTMTMMTKRKLSRTCHRNFGSAAGSSSSSSTALAVRPGGRSSRQDEIRRKIRDLKKDGKIKNKSATTTTGGTTPAVDQYADKITQKLGRKGGITKDGVLDQYYSASTSTSSDETDTPSTSDDMETFLPDDEEADLTEQISLKLAERIGQEADAERQARRALSPTGSALGPTAEDIAEAMERELALKEQQTPALDDAQNSDAGTTPQTTSGIGGSWAANATSSPESYRPANGGWGYFPRPKDISKAYGGGKRIGAGVTTSREEEDRMAAEEENTKERLKRYREKVGIDVESEKENKEEIEEALEIGQRAMQRGVYDVAVSALEKVTRYCSTNSKLGGKVFLELAMAYEAVGRSDEAVRVYTQLTFSRIEEIKMNSKRLLTGIEAMQFMRDDLKAPGFQKGKSTQTFIDTTGLGNIANNFDDRYQTAYVDLNKGGNFYRKLTENVVRSVREARQILLRSTCSGEVNRAKIVQALRLYDREFEDALRNEIEKNTVKEEPVALMNGLPIAIAKQEKEGPSTGGMDAFTLSTAEQMRDNLLGEWKLQLVTGKKGDDVSFFDKSVSWQNIALDKDENSSSIMSYRLSLPAAFFTLSQRGQLDFNNKLRVASRSDVKTDGASFLTSLVGKSSACVAANAEQQIISVDSELLICRLAVDKTKTLSENVNNYYSVWRRVEPGIYSSSDN